MRDKKAPVLAKHSHNNQSMGFFWFRRLQLLAGITAILGVVLAPAIVQAETLISQGFLSDKALPVGSIVSLDKDSATKVNVATVSNVNSMIGVVIDSGNSQVSLSSTEGTSVQVATSGVEKVLVSDINGAINAGDQITASPIAGMGMKATGTTKVIGVAQGNFPNSTASKQTYEDKNKQKHDVKLGDVAALINVTYYYKTPDKTVIPPALQNVANALAGKSVSTVPVLISIGIFIVTLIVVVSIIYTMIHSSIISVGRNPMAQAAVYRNVIQLSVLIVIILAVAVTAIYMILRRL